MAFDAHLNFSYSLIATAPVPAASGTTFSVTAGEGALFPAVSFNAVVWPAGSNPTTANAEVVRVTSKGTGDNWTVTRTQESSSARTIAVGDQIAAGMTAKMLTDVEARVVTAETNITTNTTAIAFAATGRMPGGRLTLTTALPVTTADVTAATTLYYTFYIHNVISLYSGTAWVDRTFTELSIAVPATTSQMYDVFVYDNAGTPTLELLAWTNDTTRATALVRQDGRWCKTGALTRLYVGSFRTTTVSGQTEDSFAKRYVWNYFNRLGRLLRVTESTDTWTYTTATWRQANAAAANQIDLVVGIAEVALDVEAIATAQNASSVAVYTGIGEDSTSAPASTSVGMAGQGAVGATAMIPFRARLMKYPAVGRHFYAWLERSAASGTTTWHGDNGDATLEQNGIVGRIEG